MFTSMCKIACFVIILSLSTKMALANKVDEVPSTNERFYIASPSIEWSTSSIPRDLTLQTLSMAHLQAILTVMATERDYAFNISSDSRLTHVRYPLSYRTTILQIGSDMHKTFTDVHSTMQRMRLAMQRIPSTIKTILRFLTAGSSVLASRIIPKSINIISQIAIECENFIQRDRKLLTVLVDFYQEIKQYMIDLPFKSIAPSSSTDITIYKEFHSKTVLDNIRAGLQDIDNKLNQVAQIVANLDMTTKFNLPVNGELSCMIPMLRTIEHNAYYIYQLASVYGNVLSKYVLDETAGFGKYIILSSETERIEKLSELTEKLSSNIEETEQLLNKNHKEIEVNSAALQQAYENLLKEHQCRS